MAIPRPEPNVAPTGVNIVKAIVAATDVAKRCIVLCGMVQKRISQSKPRKVICEDELCRVHRMDITDDQAYNIHSSLFTSCRCSSPTSFIYMQACRELGVMRRHSQLEQYPTVNGLRRIESRGYLSIVWFR